MPDEWYNSMSFHHDTEELKSHHGHSLFRQQLLLHPDSIMLPLTYANFSTERITSCQSMVLMALRYSCDTSLFGMVTFSVSLLYVR